MNGAIAQMPGPQPVVTSPLVERDVPASIRLVGTVAPEKRAVVAAEVSGIVQEFGNCEGRFFKAGEVICRLDADLAQMRLDEAKAQFGALKAFAEELSNGTRPETIAKHEAIVEEAKAMHEKWEFERSRLKALFDGGRGSEKEVNDAEKEYRAAERRLAAEQSELALWKNGARREQMAKATFEAAAQDAVVRRLQRERERTEIRAPFDGFIVAKRTEIGEWINAGFGTSAVAEMVAVDTVRVRVDVPELAIPFARVGENVTVEVEALGRTFTAPIARVIPQAVATARTFPVEIDVKNADHTLLPGMFVWAHVPSGPGGKRLMVNKDAVVTRGAAKQIFVVRAAPPPSPAPPGAAAGPGAAPSEPGFMAIPMSVNTGMEIGGEVEVSAPGLAAGDSIVIRANERLMGPTPVIPMPAAAVPTTQAAKN